MKEITLTLSLIFCGTTYFLTRFLIRTLFILFFDFFFVPQRHLSSLVDFNAPNIICYRYSSSQAVKEFDPKCTQKFQRNSQNSPKIIKNPFFYFTSRYQARYKTFLGSSTTIRNSTTNKTMCSTTTEFVHFVFHPM